MIPGIMAAAIARAIPSDDGDPFFANVTSLLHFEGTPGDSVFHDIKGAAWIVTGAPVLSSSATKFGKTSADITGTSRIDASGEAFNFGVGDYTVEVWMRPDASSNRSAFSFGPRLVYLANRNWAYFAGGSNIIIGGAFVADSFSHVALTRSAGVSRLFVNGQVAGTSNLDSGVAINPGAMRIGAYNAGNPSGRFYDEFRVTKGVARYVTNFVPPVSPFPNR